MEKIIILGLMLCCMFSCKHREHTKLSPDERVMVFYNEFKNYNFDSFKCINISQWNQDRFNSKEEYQVEYYKNCKKDKKKPLRGKLKFEKGQPIFKSDYINKDLSLFRNFYQLKVSNLIYQNPERLIITIYPDITMIRSCKTESEYQSLDGCWHYRILQ